jgi:hypothetical protein
LWFFFLVMNFFWLLDMRLFMFVGFNIQMSLVMNLLWQLRDFGLLLNFGFQGLLMLDWLFLCLFFWLFHCMVFNRFFTYRLALLQSHLFLWLWGIFKTIRAMINLSFEVFSLDRRIFLSNILVCLRYLLNVILGLLLHHVFQNLFPFFLF